MLPPPTQPLHPCVFCLHASCVELKADRKGRPYTICRVCATRSFMHTSIALRGLSYLAPQLVRMWVAGQAGQLLQQLDQQRDEEAQAAYAATAAGAR